MPDDCIITARSADGTEYLETYGQDNKPISWVNDRSWAARMPRERAEAVLIQCKDRDGPWHWGSRIE